MQQSEFWSSAREYASGVRRIGEKGRELLPRYANDVTVRQRVGASLLAISATVRVDLTWVSA